MTDLAALLKGVRDVVGPITVDSKALTALAGSVVPDAPRRRAAVLAHDGYMTLEAYQKARPWVFYGSLATAVGATGMAWYRKRRGAEAVTSWGLLATVAGLIAYLTRPGVSEATTGPQGSTAAQRAYQWLDARASYLDRVEPGWEQTVTAKVMGQMG